MSPLTSSLLRIFHPRPLMRRCPPSLVPGSPTSKFRALAGNSPLLLLPPPSSSFLPSLGYGLICVWCTAIVCARVHAYMWVCVFCLLSSRYGWLAFSSAVAATAALSMSGKLFHSFQLSIEPYEAPRTCWWHCICVQQMWGVCLSRGSGNTGVCVCVRADAPPPTAAVSTDGNISPPRAWRAV